jgi:hypothetical protein
MKLSWQKGVLYVAIMGMEGCWLYALMALLNKQVAGGYLSVHGILIIYPLGFIFNMLLLRLRCPKACIWGVSWLAWAMSMLLIVKAQLFGGLSLLDSTWLLSVPRSIADLIYTFKPDLLILLGTGVMWWLGRRLAYLKVNFGALLSEFQFGLLILLIAFFAAAQLRVELGSSVPIVLTFFLFALLGISIGHALEGTSWLSGLYQGHWSGLLLVSISLVLLLGLLISAVVTPDFLELAVAALKWFLGLILKLIALIASLFPEPEPAELPPAAPMPEMEPSEGFKIWTLPEPVRSGLRIGLYVLWLGLIVVALWRLSSDIFGWLRRKLAGMAGAEFESLPGAFRADLLGWFKRVFVRLLGLRLPIRFGARAPAVLPEIASVRQVYRQLLRWASAAGWPRHVSQTPYEYLHALAQLMPEAQGDLGLITGQYVRTRYGALLLTEDELHQLRQSWRNVRQNKLKKGGKYKWIK